MKKVALITTNKILAQSLAAAMKASPELEFEPFLLLNARQALLDAEIFEIDVALIDVMERDLEEKETPMSFCDKSGTVLDLRAMQSHTGRKCIRRLPRRDSFWYIGVCQIRNIRNFSAACLLS